MSEKTNKGKMEKSKIKRRKRLNVIVNRFIIVFCFLFLVGLISFGGWWIFKTVFSIKDVYAESNVKYDSETIIKVSGIERGDNLCLLNSASSEMRICRELSYIEEASVVKLFPNKVKIETNIAEPKFNLLHEEKYLLVSRGGKILEERDEPQPEVPLLTGLNFSISEESKITYESEEIQKALVSIFQFFEDNRLLAACEVDVSDIENITINYDNRIRIILGNGEDIEYKLLTAHEIITGKIRNSETGTLNLSSLTKDNRSYFTSDLKKS